MEEESSEGRKNKHLAIVKPEPMKIDWSSVPYPGYEEAGRGGFEYEGEILNVVVKYYSCQRTRFEKQRHFAEVILNNKEKFIIDGIEQDPLIQHVADMSWTIFECRKKMRQANTNLKRIK